MAAFESQKGAAADQDQNKYVGLQRHETQSLRVDLHGCYRLQLLLSGHDGPYS